MYLHFVYKSQNSCHSYLPTATYQYSDVTGMFELWPVMKRCTVVAKKELLYAGPFGLAAWLCGLVFIDRLNADSSRQAINNSIKQLREEEVTFVVLSPFNLVCIHLIFYFYFCNDCFLV